MTTATAPVPVEELLRDRFSRLQAAMVHCLRTAVDEPEDADAAEGYQKLAMLLRVAAALPVEPLPFVPGDVIDCVVDHLGHPLEDALAQRLLTAGNTHALGDALGDVYRAATTAGYVTDAADWDHFRARGGFLRRNFCPSWRGDSPDLRGRQEVAGALLRVVHAADLSMYDFPTEVYADSRWSEPSFSAPAHGWSVAHIVPRGTSPTAATRRIWWRAWGSASVEYLAEERVNGHWSPVADLPRRRVDVDTLDELDELIQRWVTWLTAVLPQRKPQRVGWYATDRAPGQEEILWYCDGHHWYLVARTGDGARLELSDNPGRWDRCPASKPRRIH